MSSHSKKKILKRKKNKQKQNTAVDNIIQNNTTDDTKYKKYHDDIIACANAIYEYVNSNEVFNSIKNKKKKINHISSINNSYKQFVDSFPYISNQLINYKKYTTNAFSRFYYDYYYSKVFSEDQWAKINANYVKYLWEDACKSNKKKINNDESKKVFEDAYKSILQKETQHTKELKKKQIEQEQKRKEQHEAYKNEMSHNARVVWSLTKMIAKENDEFKNMDDKNKLKFIKKMKPLYKNFNTNKEEEFDVAEFMKQFPLVSRYMICMGQYSETAFRKFLDKLVKTKIDPVESKKKGYSQEQWVRRKADYIKYLWIAYQKGHYNAKYAQLIWEDAYKKLKGEMDDFENTYEKVQQEVKQEYKENKADNARDLLTRILSRKQQLSETSMGDLMEKMKHQLVRHKLRICLKALCEVRKPIKPTCEGEGTSQYKEGMRPMSRIIPDDKLKKY